MKLKIALQFADKPYAFYSGKRNVTTLLIKSAQSFTSTISSNERVARRKLAKIENSLKNIQE